MPAPWTQQAKAAMDGRAERIGGAAAIALGVFAVAGAAAEVAAILAVRLHDAGARRDAALAQGLIALLGGLAQLAAVRGVRFALGPPMATTGKVVWAASALGWLGAAALALAGLLDLYGALTRAPELAPLLSTLALCASALTAVWAVGVCAAAWKVKQLPSWVRVTGVVFGVLVIVNIVLPMLRALTLFAELAWWFGLGFALLRSSRIPQSDLPKTTT